MAELSLDRYWQLPPIARTFATATFALSVGIHFKLIPGYYFVYSSFFINRLPPQIWRFVTCFMITGPQLGMLFDTYLIYNYMSQLEKGHPRLSKRADFAWYLIFVCGTILNASTAITVPENEEEYPCTSGRSISQGLACGVGMGLSQLTGFGFSTLTQALILAMCYTATQEQAGGQTNYMFITIPSQLVPYAMIAINLFFPGGVMSMIQQLHGLVAAHLYLFLTKVWPQIGGGRNFLETPTIVSTLVGESGGPQRAGFGAQPSARTSGTSSGPLPDSWRTRGPGQRLG
ncbi:DER1-like family member protein 1 [Cladobotryum mycophilum]|uniref:Derlin n=1 Tax=Cladobotryum mycophilum TaxID=491253 RepID=A0ABR0SMK6_9HYPO